MSLEETPWVDKSLRSAWDRIAAHVPESWMPQREVRNPASRIRPKVVEFACGHYGCVMPTNEPGLVCKLTTDVSEARFVRMTQELNTSDAMSSEIGIVKYKKIFKLEGLTYRNRPMFVLWRSEAFDIGLLRHSQLYIPPAAEDDVQNRFGYDKYHLRNIREGVRLLENFNKLARITREMLRRRLVLRDLHYKSKETIHRLWEELLTPIWESYENADTDMDPRHAPARLRPGIALRQCLAIAQEIGNTDVVYPIGLALAYYLEEGILLADVHLGNIGRDAPYEPGGPLPNLIITDPGHAVEFHPRWATPPGVEVI